jgi:hypothetical protein
MSGKGGKQQAGGRNAKEIEAEKRKEAGPSSMTVWVMQQSVGGVYEQHQQACHLKALLQIKTAGLLSGGAADAKR